MGSNFKEVAMTAAICVAVTVISLVAYDRYFATKIVVLDTTSYLQDVREQYVKGKMSDEELEKRLLKLKNALESQPKNSVVLNAEVVMKNAKRIEP